MYKTIIISATLMLSSMFVHSQDTARIVANAQVIKVSESKTQKANEDVLTIIKDPEVDAKFFDHFIFLGPYLWDRIKGLDEFKNIKGGDITYKVPKFEADGSWKKTVGVTGKILQTIGDFKNLFKWLRSSLNLSSATIVEKNLTDKFIYWLYFAKIEEPLIAVQNDKMRLIFTFADKGLMFIELTKW